MHNFNPHSMTASHKATPSKVSSKDRVTLAMLPYEQYSTFPKAVDALYEHLHHPFDLIIVEGNAPDSVKSALEKRKLYHGNIKLIYTPHIPLAAEARNIARPHIRTPFAFFMDNDIRVSEGWLSALVHTAKEKSADIVYPFISNTESPAVDVPGINTHGFLITKEALDSLGEFDENVSAGLLGIDLILQAKSKNKKIAYADGVHLARNFPYSGKSADKKLFDRQWNEESFRQSIIYFKQKWKVEVDEKRYLQWLKEKHRNLQKRVPSDPLKRITDHLQSRLNFAKISAGRLLHTFVSL